MAKQGGLGDMLLVGGYDLSGDIQSLGKISGGPATITSTDITQKANSVFGGLRSGEIDMTTYFDVAAGKAHPILSALPRSDVQISYMRGAGLLSPMASMIAKQQNYDGSRGNDGSFTFSVTALSNAYGLEWGVQLTNGVRDDTAATTGTDVDESAGTSFGAQAYVHLLGFTGTSVTIEIDHSSDNSSYSSLMSTSALTAVGTARLSVSNATTVNRYLKVKTTGTFTVANFVINWVRNSIAGVKF